MATIAGHLSVDALRERYVSSSDALVARPELYKSNILLLLDEYPC
jgi:hypothetical protein